MYQHKYYKQKNLSHSLNANLQYTSHKAVCVCVCVCVCVRGIILLCFHGLFKFSKWNETIFIEIILLREKREWEWEALFHDITYPKCFWWWHVLQFNEHMIKGNEIFHMINIFSKHIQHLPTNIISPYATYINITYNEALKRTWCLQQN